MKNSILTFIAVMTFGFVAHAEDVATQEPTKFQYMQKTQMFQFKLDMAKATPDSLVQLMENTTQEYYAMFVDGGECHSGSQLSGVIKKNSGFLVGTITVILDGDCRNPAETEEEAFASTVAWIKEGIADIPGIVLNW